MSVSLARRLALLEAKLAALRSKKDVRVELKDFAQPAPAAARTDDPVVDSKRRTSWPCPADDCGGTVARGDQRCRRCGAEIVWPSEGERR
jgi:predicted RNA-binding Zn-ribbon protein involved in translation (DUF1610 family)